MNLDEMKATVNLRQVAEATTGVLHPHAFYFPHHVVIDVRVVEGKMEYKIVSSAK